jgi:putative CRISPR-associated protein (TIGR02619 family)
MSDVLLFITCGTSALTNLTGPQTDTTAPQLAADLSGYLDTPKVQKDDFAVRQRLLERLKKAHAAFWDTPAWFSNPRKYRKTSAELISTHALGESFKQHGYKVSRIVMLRSDTPEGELAANVNMHFLSHHQHFKTMFASAQRQLKKIDGWDARFVENLHESIEQIALAERTGLDEFRPNGIIVYFNITGGFKGAIPAITALGMKHCWRLYYQHETLSTSVFISLSENQFLVTENDTVNDPFEV